MQGGASRYFYGPLLPDLIEAIKTGVPVGGFLGFFIAGLATPWKPWDLSKCVVYGSGLVSTFTVFLVLSSRFWQLFS